MKTPISLLFLTSLAVIFNFFSCKNFFTFSKEFGGYGSFTIDTDLDKDGAKGGV